MNALPTSRHVINGRTYSQSWSASQHDPIEVYRSGDRISSFFVALVCVAGSAVIGALMAQAF